LLRAERGLLFRHGKLHIELAAEDRRFQEMLIKSSRVIFPRADEYGGWLRVTHKDGSQIFLLLMRSTRRLERVVGINETRAGFLVFVANQVVDGSALSRRLREAWNLTSAEIALAIELLESDSLHAAAERLRISRNTAKTQLSSIFQKAGVRKQSELTKKA